MFCFPKCDISSHFLRLSSRGWGNISCEWMKSVENLALSYRFPACRKYKFLSSECLVTASWWDYNLHFSQQYNCSQSTNQFSHYSYNISLSFYIYFVQEGSNEEGVLLDGGVYYTPCTIKQDSFLIASFLHKVYVKGLTLFKLQRILCYKSV